MIHYGDNDDYEHYGKQQDKEMKEFVRDPGTTWNLSEVIEVLTHAYEYFDNKSDAEILPDGIHANPEMRLARETSHALEYIEHLRKQLKGIAK